MRWNLVLAGLTASWGFIAVLVAAVDLGAEALAFLRIAVAAATLGAVALVAQHTLRPGRALPALVVLGIVQGAHWLLFFESVKHGSVALATLTFYSAPLLIAVAAPVFLPERLSNVALGAILVGGGGVVLVVLGGDAEGDVSLAAVAAGLGSAATYAMLVILSKRLLVGRVPPLTVAFWSFGAAALALAPFLLAADRVIPAGVGEWGAVLVLGVVFSGLATLVYYTLLRRVTAQVAGILTFLEPVAGVLLAWLLVDQPISVTTALGGVLVLLAGMGVVALEPGDGGVTEAVPRVGSASQ